MPAKSVATTQSLCEAASMMTLGSPSRSPEGARLAGSTNRSASRSSAPHRVGASRPGRPLFARARARRPGAQSRQFLAAADMGEAPVQVRRQGRRASSRSSNPFFATARPTVTTRRGSAGSDPSRDGGSPGRRGTATGRGRDRRARPGPARPRPRAAAPRRPPCRSPRRRAGDRRACPRAPSPAWSRCLGVGRRAPPPSGERGGVAGDRGRGVQVVDVDVVGLRRQLAGEHQGLAEAPPRGWR